MARLNRVSPVGVPQHIIQRGTNRQAIFAGESDMRDGWGENQEERHEAYREMFKTQVGKALLKEIRESTNRGLALGSSSFGEQIEKLTSCRVTKKKMGRPKKK